MFIPDRKKWALNKSKKPNKVLNALNKKKQTNQNMKYVINPHSRKNMNERHISERDVVKSIEEFDTFSVNEDRSIVEKKIWNEVVRTVYSMNMYTNEINVITTMHINKTKFAKQKTDIL